LEFIFSNIQNRLKKIFT